MAQSQYSLKNHSILQLIYRVIHPNKSKITYLLKDPKSKSLIMFGQNASSLNQFMKENTKHIQDIEKQTQSQLKYIFLNQYSASTRATSVLRDQQIITSQSQGDLKPLIIGDLSVCFVDSKGYRNPFSLIAVTHLTQTSTKFPVLFPSTLINVCSINYKNNQIKSAQYLNSLQKIKYFPNQTYIFPSQAVVLEDLLFAKALIQNQFIDQKIQIFRKNQKHGDALIPTTVLQQKMFNPFLTSNKFGNILGTSKKQKSFNLLRKMRQQFKI